ncbi:Na+/H+ antiporter NhaA [Catenuloplanes japonicus]|uniref:Na+/H+ antiporter NhaA n=1 Tax=Catenuloplanes japonicus TaxID=33876 RepID=UPI000A1051A2|nr:Na+/H+ antiporter NhaA [Catenuloplanes japonicus]
MTAPPRPGPALRIATPQLNPALRSFLSNEAGSGAALLIGTVLAIAWANSPWWESYFALWHTHVSLHVGGWALEMDLHHVINDALMAVFFLVLGLEISREAVSGELRDRRTMLVPTLGAIGGMILPIAIFLAVNPSGDAARGWGVVMSTDTAFVLGVLALFGPRCPDQLRVFLLTLAVVDDIGAIGVLAVFYTDSVDVGPLIFAAVLLGAVLLLRWLGVWRLAPYVFLTIAMWIAVYESGVHPTLAGVLIGLSISAKPASPEQIRRVPLYGRALMESQSAERAQLAVLQAAATVSASERMERRLHPWSAYLVIPAFGLANAGVRLTGDVVADALVSPLTIGVIIALVAGNTLGIFGASWIALRTGLGVLPGRVRYSHLLGGSILAGMGFTISLFITDLAFEDQQLRDQAKIGILAGSFIAAAIGAWVIRWMGERSPLCSPAGDSPPALPPLPWVAPASPAPPAFGMPPLPDQIASTLPSASGVPSSDNTPALSFSSASSASFTSDEVREVDPGVASPERCEPGDPEGTKSPQEAKEH